MARRMIQFRDDDEMWEALCKAAGPFGDASKVARAAVRKGLQEMGFWPLSKKGEPKGDVDPSKS